MIKKILIFYLFIGNVLAINEANVSINPDNPGICFAVNNITDIHCAGENFLIDGTRDSVLYIEYEPTIRQSDNITTIAENVALTPFSLITGLLLVFIVIGFTFLIILGAILLLVKMMGL